MKMVFARTEDVRNEDGSAFSGTTTDRLMKAAELCDAARGSTTLAAYYRNRHDEDPTVPRREIGVIRIQRAERNIQREDRDARARQRQQFAEMVRHARENDAVGSRAQ